MLWTVDNFPQLPVFIVKQQNPNSLLPSGKWIPKTRDERGTVITEKTRSGCCASSLCEATNGRQNSRSNAAGVRSQSLSRLILRGLSDRWSSTIFLDLFPRRITETHFHVLPFPHQQRAFSFLQHLYKLLLLILSEGKAPLLTKLTPTKERNNQTPHLLQNPKSKQ